jgi:hypothetical protein
MFKIGVMWLAAILWAAAAQAQVAVPSIVPGIYATENPAAIKWGAPTSVGMGYLESSSQRSQTGSTYGFSGASAGLRWVSERYAVAGEQTTLDSYQVPGFKEKTSSASGQVAVQLGSSFAIGGGMDSRNLDGLDISALGGIYNRAYVPAGHLARDTSQEGGGGISWRMGDTFFVGASGGRERFTVLDQTSGAFVLDGSRDVVKAGIGYRRGGRVLTHVEVYSIQRQDFAPPGGTPFGGSTLTAGVLEFNFSGLLVAYTTKGATATDQSTTTTSSYDIGLAGTRGLTFVAHSEERKVDRTALGFGKDSDQVTALQVSFLF